MSFVILLLLCHLLAHRTLASTLHLSLPLSMTIRSEIAWLPEPANLTNPKLDCLVGPYSMAVEEHSCRNALAKIPRTTQPHIYKERPAIAVNTIALPIRYLSGELRHSDSVVIFFCRPRYDERHDMLITWGPELVEIRCAS